MGQNAESRNTVVLSAEPRRARRNASLEYDDFEHVLVTAVRKLALRCRPIARPGRPTLRLLLLMD